MPFETRIPLICHPHTPGAPIHGLEVSVCRDSDGLLYLDFDLHGELKHLRIPKPGPARQGDRLWEHTCFEAFVGLPDRESYHEFNVAPSGQWAAYAFQRRRERMPWEMDAELPIHLESSGKHLKLSFQIPLKALSAQHSSDSLRLGISTIVEDETGARSFWALCHPSERPDFHHPESFALSLPTPEAGSISGSDS